MSPTYTEMTSVSTQSTEAITISANIYSQSTTTKKNVGRKPLYEEVKVKRAQDKEMLRFSKIQAKANKAVKK